MAGFSKINRWLLLMFFALLFSGLLGIRTGVFSRAPSRPEPADLPAAPGFEERNTWMNIHQGGRKIGYSNTRFTKTDEGYRFHETAFMRINTMGMTQDMELKTSGTLNPDFSLDAFTFQVSSGRFDFSAHGSVSDDGLAVTIESAGSRQHLKLDPGRKIFLPSGTLRAAVSRELQPGQRLSLEIFDPVTLGQETVEMEVLGAEEIRVEGQNRPARKLAVRYKGITQLAWIDETGDVLKEQGLLGITLERTTREDALFGFPVQPSQDLTRIASIPANIDIPDPTDLTRLEAEIGGTQNRALNLDGGRQAYRPPVLVIEKERISGKPSPVAPRRPEEDPERYLDPEPLIASDHEAIVRLAAQITAGAGHDLDKAARIVAWIQEHIEKRPVLSMPDALAVLENRAGDCNEHAVLFAALARACGIPTRIEAGVVYLRGRFYYHAWNAVYLGEWVTLDALFNQIPADVTHIRLTRGRQKDQLDIVGLIGSLSIQILDGTR